MFKFKKTKARISKIKLGIKRISASDVMLAAGILFIYAALFNLNKILGQFVLGIGLIALSWQLNKIKSTQTKDETP